MKSITTITLFLLFQILAFGQNWELAKDKNDIQVYLKEVPNSALKAYKVTTTLSNTSDKVKGLILDVENYDKWMHNTYDPKIISSGEQGILMHAKIAAPWPVKDRDNVVLLEMKPKENGFKVNFINKPDDIPDSSDHIRMEGLTGYWEVVDKDGKVIITQYVHADPGGSIPAWLANSTVISTPFETFSNLKEMLKN